MSIHNLIREEILNLPAYHLEEHPGIKLDQNESPWDIPVPIKAQVVEEALRIPWNRYPLGEFLQLKKKMAKHLNVWPDNLTFANGSNVLIQALVVATSLKSKVLVLDPSFSLYETEARLLENEVIKIPLEKDFSIPKDKALHTIQKEKPSLIFIPNPNVPTGNLFDLDVLKKIIEEAHCPVVIDEAYYPYTGTTLIDWIKMYDHLVILRSFSKALALGGIRLGYLIADPELARQVEKCLLPFCINRLVFATAFAVLDNMDYVDRYVRAVRSERNRVFEKMRRIPQIKTYSSKTNFILFEVRNPEIVFRKLVEEGIVIRNVSDGKRLANALRVTIGTKEENEAFLNALKKVVVQN
jgi:histidinol-phosphate aminotransferase